MINTNKLTYFYLPLKISYLFINYSYKDIMKFYSSLVRSTQRSVTLTYSFIKVDNMFIRYTGGIKHAKEWVVKMKQVHIKEKDNKSHHEEVN